LSLPSQPNDDHNLLLSQAVTWLPLLGGGDKAEFFFYTLDLHRNLKYVSDSVWSISRIRPEDWLNKSVMPILTDHIWNEFLSNSDTDMDPNTVYRLRIEVWDFESNRVKLEMWRRLIIHHSQPIGFVGMARRYTGPSFSEVALSSVDPSELKRRLETLTSREIEVVKLVVKGELNKSIAKKLNVAMRTVEARRSKAMEKLGVNRLSDLIRVWISGMEASAGDSENGQDDRS
jgi:DNA-binding CsgD family transcriptional regulator